VTLYSSFYVVVFNSAHATAKLHVVKEPPFSFTAGDGPVPRAPGFVRADGGAVSHCMSCATASQNSSSDPT
jgi:hypothetical protein